MTTARTAHLTSASSARWARRPDGKTTTKEAKTCSHKRRGIPLINRLLLPRLEFSETDTAGLNVVVSDRGGTGCGGTGRVVARGHATHA